MHAWHPNTYTICYVIHVPHILTFKFPTSISNWEKLLTKIYWSKWMNSSDMWIVFTESMEKSIAFIPQNTHTSTHDFFCLSPSLAVCAFGFCFAHNLFYSTHWRSLSMGREKWKNYEWKRTLDIELNQIKWNEMNYRVSCGKCFEYRGYTQYTYICN